MVQNKQPEIHLKFNLRILVVDRISGNGGDMFECFALLTNSVQAPSDRGGGGW